MYQDIYQLIESRVSVNYFESMNQVSDQQIKTLISLATCAPTAYNLQNWKFIVVRTPAAKIRLKALAFEQQKIIDASVNIIVCGTLNAHETLASTLKPSVDQGIFESTVVDQWVTLAHNAHHANPQLQRDEAIRSASLAAMTLMLAAEGMGLATCAIGGFDELDIAHEFQLSSFELPVMILSVGYKALGNWPQKIRKPLVDVMTII